MNFSSKELSLCVGSFKQTRSSSFDYIVFKYLEHIFFSATHLLFAMVQWNVSLDKENCLETKKSDLNVSVLSTLECMYMYVSDGFPGVWVCRE